jgi:methyltransferase-like protein/cyclopropane fatty-acyl-phospholipid synthase-like methyltransferase
MSAAAKKFATRSQSDVQVPRPFPIAMTTSPASEFTRAIGAAYDETPYVSPAFPQTHPDKLCAMGRLFGLDAPAPARARVLELGCADGSNLLPMAQHAPDARFLGIDASAKQVASAQAAIGTCGLGNVEIRQQDILEFAVGEGKFDYIIAHGIFSWVPAEVREKVLTICRDNLSENGVAFVSYNALPGWGMRLALRDMLMFHTQALQDPRAKVQQARALTAFLAEAVSTEGDPYGLLLRQELEKLARDADDYVRHDLLGEINQPFYFHEFISLAASANLQYLSEPSLAQMLPSNFPPKTQEMLRKLGSNPIAQEQYMDFVRNQNFRQTLLCHAGQKLKRSIQPELIQSFYYTSVITKPEAGTLHLQPGVAHTFQVKNNVAALTVESPFPKAVFAALADAKLDRISYPELVKGAKSTASPFLMGDELQRRAAREESVLGQSLAQLYMRGLIDIFADRPQLKLTSTEKPAATPLARYQAAQGSLVTNRAHDSIQLDASARFVVMACNGERDAAGIVDFLAALAQEGRLKLSEPGRPLESEANVRASLQRRVAIALPKLAAAGLF